MNTINDPLLGGNNMYQLPNMAEFERQQAAIQQRMESVRQMQAQYAQQAQPQIPIPASPVWDEIDKVTAELSDAEFAYLEQNDEFVESSRTLTGLLQREYMRMMRPIVEATKDGRDALDKHLTLIRRLRKTVKDEANKRDALMNEYMTSYSHLSWNDFIAMKQGKYNQQLSKTE